MRLFTLDARLQKIGALIEPGAALADVGSDHGKLPVSLLKRGVIRRAVISDIGEKPLARARETARRFGVEEAIRFVRCDGLGAIAPHEADTVVIAGMGGETIVKILREAPWTTEGKHKLILQPMSSVEELRAFLCDAGYGILSEHLVADGGRIYLIITAVGTGTARPHDLADDYAGWMLRADPLFHDYAAAVLRRMGKERDGARRQGWARRAEALDEAMNKIQQSINEVRENAHSQ